MCNGDDFHDIDLAFLVVCYSYCMAIHIPQLLFRDGFLIGYLFGALIITFHFLWFVNKWRRNRC